LKRFPAVARPFLSNTSSLPEIGGDAALYFDPHDSATLKDAFEHIISDNSLRIKLILKGYERSILFS